MGSIVILTDSTAQYTLPSFNGRSLVKVLPLNIESGGTVYEGGRNLKPNEMPLNLNDANHPRLLQPSVEQIRQFLSQDENGYPMTRCWQSSCLHP